jgi:riboflavin kinase/FMN adenylyltransferase
MVGRKIGFPTINIHPSDGKLLPPNGVYVTRTSVNNNMYKSVTNIGVNPTVGTNSVTIETYLLAFNKRVYEGEVTVEFHLWLRDEKRFNDLTELQKQITEDVAKAAEYFNV